MKNTMTIVAVAAIIAVGAGFLGFSFASNQSSPNQPLVTSALMNGHLEIIATDPNGQIKAYRQTDNAITIAGENCVAKALFKGTGTGAGSQGTAGCTGAVTSPWVYLAVGTGTGTETNTSTALGTELATSGLTRALATTVTITNSTTGGAGSSAASVSVAKTFTVSGTQTVTEAGLFNETSSSNTDSMFARKVFTGVTVNNGDSLTVTWTVNIGNTTTFN